MSDAIIRTDKRRDPYTQLDKRFIEDEAISFKAKGLLAYLLAKPDDWQIRLSQLAWVGPDGRESIRSALRELEAAGYITRVHPKNAKGRFSHSKGEG